MHALSRIGQRCFCGHHLRTQSEQEKGWCIECKMQASLNAARIDEEVSSTQTLQVLSPLAHIVRQAVVAEQRAITLSQRKPINDEPAFLHVYDYCQALDQIAFAIKQWAYVSARLWFLQEQEESNQEKKVALSQLHQWSIKQFKRIFAIHFTMQTRLHHFCEQHCILLTFTVIDQALDLTAGKQKTAERLFSAR